MTIARLLPVAVTLAAVACGPRESAPPAGVPQGLKRIAVSKPANRTGEKLSVDERGLLSNFLDEKRTSVPELLAGSLRTELARRGFQVVTGTGVPTLQIELRRWEPYSVDYSSVTVDLVASLVDSGSTLWTADRSNWTVATDDADSSIESAEIGAKEVAKALLDGWEPAGAAARRKAAADDEDDEDE